MPYALRRIAAVFGLALALVVVTGPRLACAYDDGYDRRPPRHEESRSRPYNDEYIFATTRMVSEMDVHPAVKVPLFPPAIVIDLVFLPAEVIAGLF
jgi:hypothetical protein